jgi:molybdate transport system ATP-binding protein
MARALARDPRVLLLDEPFSAVDRSTREVLYRELAALKRELAMPMILVTHDIEEAAMLADRMSILHRGRTLQAGPPFELMARPASPLVARLVGLRNIFTARIAAHDPANAVTWIDWAGQRLECALAQSFPAGSEAAWIVPASHILLHRRDRPSRGERENPVRAVIAEFLPLGENVSVRLSVADGAASLQASFSLHVARRNGLERGVEVRVSLLRDGIHLMHAGISEMGSDSI